MAKLTAQFGTQGEYSSRILKLLQQVEEYASALRMFAREEDVHSCLAACPELTIAAFQDGAVGLDMVSKFPLGIAFVTDFIVVGVRSYGIPYHVVLVELESPRARAFNRDGTFSRVLNKAQAQIQEWQHWLRDHHRRVLHESPHETQTPHSY